MNGADTEEEKGRFLVIHEDKLLSIMLSLASAIQEGKDRLKQHPEWNLKEVVISKQVGIINTRGYNKRKF